MTEYETATLALREPGTLGAFAQVAATFPIGTAKCVLIYAGQHRINRANDAFNRRLDAAENSHIEAMQAMETL